MKARANSVICEINITPLTDIFLVLLIIMMVVTPLMDFAGLESGVGKPKEEETTEPSTSNDEDEKEPGIALYIASDGTFEVDGDPFEQVALVDALRAKAADPDGVKLEVANDAHLQHMTRAMEACREAGITKIEVNTEKAIVLDAASVEPVATVPAPAPEPAKK